MSAYSLFTLIGLESQSPIKPKKSCGLTVLNIKSNKIISKYYVRPMAKKYHWEAILNHLNFLSK